VIREGDSWKIQDDDVEHNACTGSDDQAEQPMVILIRARSAQKPRFRTLHIEISEG